MCGIAGIFERDGRPPVDGSLLKAMCDAMRRRGPNDEGFYVSRQVGLGMRRLSIIDVAGGHQPIANEDGNLHIVFNGEIYNYAELRTLLEQRGHRFTTRTDTEAILHLFEDEGPAALQRLRGMFAIAIWNVRERTLFVARDRMGIKPLHYAYDGRRFAFASEIGSLLADPAIDRALDWTALDGYFTYGYVPAPWTAYRAIRKLLPGHYLRISDRGVEDVEYWDLDFEPKSKASPEELEEEFTRLFQEAVQQHLLSEVPLGAFLSGGIDSSLVVAMMAQASAQPVNTFTVGFGGDQGSFLDERPYALDVSARYGTTHQALEVRPDAEGSIDLALAAFGEPFADDSIIPTDAICRLAKQHVTVVLTGLGGDENFAGYERHLGFHLSASADGFPWRQLARTASPLVQRLRDGSVPNQRLNHVKRFLAAAQLPPAQRWQRYQALFSPEERRALYEPAIAREIDFEAVDAVGTRYFESAPAESPLDKALYQDFKTYLPDDILALTDRVGMWHSLEARVPFLDHMLVEFCARLPVSMKIRLTQKKAMLRRVARRFVPPSVLDHPKQGFGSPMAAWLRCGLRSFAENSLSGPALDRTGVLKRSAVAALLTEHSERRQVNDRRIFAILVFQRWMLRFMAGCSTLVACAT
jgi:asparagine synthase (glutamine-hydrolysing)